MKKLIKTVLFVIFALIIVVHAGDLFVSYENGETTNIAYIIGEKIGTIWHSFWSGLTS